MQHKQGPRCIPGVRSHSDDNRVSRAGGFLARLSDTVTGAFGGVLQSAGWKPALEDELDMVDQGDQVDFDEGFQVACCSGLRSLV